MGGTTGILIAAVFLLVLYIVILQRQIRNINRQLLKRLTLDTKQPVSLQLINGELNKLTSNINKCLKAEETLRLESVREEKRFKELIANISHDLRTPLTAVKGYQQLLQTSELTKEQKKKLQVARKHTEELGNLIEQFFEYSYLINADPKANTEPINITNLVTECLAESVSSFEEHCIEVKLHEAPTVFAMADQGMTVRIVRNLIRNCVAYSAGDVYVAITASENAVISFKNPVKNAAVIDAARIFERFYTGDKARSKSTGLGLHIIKLLCEQMEGKVSANLNGNELTINVELPLYK
ncbi:sensor histidine kinase [Pseudobacteroides cellulosolvens]|uniref:histidine kinase n=1 Tax=Pseudobacteroides cellulosolvens ATCC 35603 = DSM 2933 TaxID=398512 RepID=A0A0L6JJP4_9FIRM|nr:HAMP domain-containing sensor histidine kinase [Pseudobacteroides cellulosolvens]KNY25960.1 histidine kinase [Pseudobacteroides cellulosolvens ATCC 35603 = DSM 2933]